MATLILSQNNHFELRVHQDISNEIYLLLPRLRKSMSYRLKSTAALNTASIDWRHADILPKVANIGLIESIKELRNIFKFIFLDSLRNDKPEIRWPIFDGLT